ncbi:MAG: hypothetical protein LBP72_09770 [Dysgonamonadaceae bacterium]|nr:hypothetical protein [Dysgonamonadaceae bacterium]
MYILFISATPCCLDNHPVDDDCRTEQPDSGDRSHEDCPGICSPFCLCNTCGGFTVIHSLTGIQLKIQTLSQSVVAYMLPIYSSLSPEDLGQPPRL